MTTGVPPLDGGERPLEIDGRTPDEQPRFVSIVTISPRFFDVVRVPLLRGRTFHDSDGAPGSETVIINERLASQFFPARIRSGGGSASRNENRAPGPARSRLAHDRRYHPVDPARLAAGCLL